MKLLGEKSLTKVDKIIKFFNIIKYNENTVKSLTNKYCKVYHINCCYTHSAFQLCYNNWISSRKIIDILAQINQYCKNTTPYVQIMCTSDDERIIKDFIKQKDKWSKSFKKLIIV